MALSDRLKGLQKHETKIPDPPVPVAESFDVARADRIIAGLHSSVSSSYPEGCLEWIRAERRDIWDALCKAENAVDRAYIDQVMGDLVSGADLLLRMYEKAFGLFISRPPVIERQEELFA